MASYSPYNGSTPGEEYYYSRDRYQSATPTPSPRSRSYYAQGSSTPQRPATRAHFRGASTGYNDYSPRPPTASPRYTSDGYYATANVSSGHHSRKASWSAPSRPKAERRASYVYVRGSTPHGESDEDEYIEVDGRTYLIPGKAHAATGGKKLFRDSYFDTVRGHPTDSNYYTQDAYPVQDRDNSYEPRPRPTANTHARRSSAANIQRPGTARPASSHKVKVEKAPPPKRMADEMDAKKHRIPAGFSLKNWDPSEQPILLLGSVFDANSLGKWIYDWTVYHHKPATPISEMAGELWILLIQLSGKVKKADETVERVRSADKKEMLEDFIESGERLQEKLRKLLKTCEQPMLKAAQKKGGALGKNAGVEFVETLFGRERELDRTERFMQGVRLFNLRFDANCDDIIRNPTH